MKIPRWRHTAEKEEKTVDKYRILTMVLVVFLAAAIIGLLLSARKRTQAEDTGDIRYERHYMFIGQAENQFITNKIFEESQKYGLEQGVYVEQMGQFPETDYGITDYLNMAMAMKVDGIILEGSDEESVRKAVNQAADMDIPVVTVLTDCAGSRRKSFIGLGADNIGREYGRQIISIADNRNPEVVLLMNEEMVENGSADEILSGIRQTLQNEGNHLQVRLRTELLGKNGQLDFSDHIHQLMTRQETKPDILICMNEKDTKLVYQSLIDYDLEGKVQIIGSCVSESLLKAVREGEIAALIHMDTEQTGRLCVDALDYYIQNKSVKEFIIADDKVITGENVERYIGDE